MDQETDNQKLYPKIANKERFTLNFRKKPVISIQEVKDFLEKLNEKSYGREVDLCDVVADAVRHYKERDILRIQESSMSSMDLIRLKYEKELSKMTEKISFEEFLAKKMGVNH